MGTATLLGNATGSGTINAGPYTTTAGSTIVLFANFDAGASPTFSHNKSGSITVTGAGFDNFGTSVGSRIARLENNPGGSGHTFTLTMSGGGHLAVVEIVGAAVASYDVSNQAADTTTPYDSPSVTTTQAAETAIGYFVSESSGTAHAAANGFTSLLYSEDYWNCCVAYKSLSSAGAVNSSFTCTGTPAGQVYVATFKDQGGGGTAVPVFLHNLQQQGIA
jgi:hypothetical protein